MTRWNARPRDGKKSLKHTGDCATGELDEDEQIIVLKAEAPEQLILDIAEGTGTEGVRLIAQNTWTMNVFMNDGDCPDGFDCPYDFDLIVQSEHAGWMTVKLQILTVG